MLNKVSEAFYLGIKKDWEGKKHILRLGQAFLNAIADGDADPDLFYAKDNEYSEKKIYQKYIDPDTIGKERVLRTINERQL